MEDFTTSSDLVTPDEPKLWGVHAVSVFVHWIEAHLVEWAALIMLGMIALMSSDATTDNALLGRNSPAVFVVAILTAVAAESSGRELVRRGHRTIEAGKVKLGRFMIVAGYFIGAFILQTIWMWRIMMSESVSEAQALNEIGSIFGLAASFMSHLWTFEGAFIFAVLFLLHAHIGYKPPKARKKTKAEIAAELREESELAPLRVAAMHARSQVRQAQAATMARTGVAVRNAAGAMFKKGDGPTMAQPQVVLTGITDLGGPDGDGPDDDPTPPRPTNRRRREATLTLADPDRYSASADRGSESGILSMSNRQARLASAVNLLMNSEARPDEETLRAHFSANGIAMPKTTVTFTNLLRDAELEIARMGRELPWHAQPVAVDVAS